MPLRLRSWIAMKVRADHRSKVRPTLGREQAKLPQFRFRATSYTFAKASPTPSAALPADQKLAIGAQQVIAGRLTGHAGDHYLIVDARIQDRPLFVSGLYLYKDHWTVEVI